MQIDHEKTVLNHGKDTTVSPVPWKFVVDEPDYALSPYTGMARRHWEQAAVFLLSGAFSHVQRFRDPPIFPKTVDITYPGRRSPVHILRAREMEGVCRTMILAAPLLASDPELTVRGYRLRDYYAEQILLMTDRRSKRFIGLGADHEKKYGGRTFQQTCECALLALNLMTSGGSIWPQFSVKERDMIAEVLSSWAHYRTQEHNWRNFNLLILTFLKLNGYPIDETIFKDHLAAILSYYGGNGWYRDGNHFDYYSTWLFNLVGPIWNSWYGYEFEKAAASIIERNHNELMKTFPYMVGRGGEVLMWGRSAAYRFAGLVPFATAFFLRNPGIEPGEARAILSRSLLHFLTREDSFIDKIPTLGYYRTFPPMVQPYNCSASVYFTGLAFLCLSLGTDSPFWRAQERNNAWETLGTGTRTVTLDGPGFSITDYGRTGAAEIRPGKTLIAPGNRYYLESYSRLAFNSAFPWESGKDGDIQSMNYALVTGKRAVAGKKAKSGFMVPNVIAWAGEISGVAYRRAAFGFSSTFRGLSVIDLAEIVVPFGMIRVDRPRLLIPAEVRLGHFGLPLNNGTADPERKTVDGYPVMTVRAGNAALALASCSGWTGIDVLERHGASPVSTRSVVPFLSYMKRTAYSGMPFLISVMLHRTDSSGWSDDELQPIASIHTDGFARAELVLKTGSVYTIDFSTMEGRLSV